MDELNPTLRPATDADLEAMVALFQAAFPRWPAVDSDVPAVEHLRWKMQSHPRALETNTVMETDGEIVGAVVQFCRDVNVGGEILVAHSGSDTAIHPRVQARGLLRHAQPYADSHIEAKFDFALNTASHHPRMRRRNARRGVHIRVSNELRMLVRPFDLRTFVGVHRGRGGWRHFAATTARAALRRRGGRRGAEPCDVQVSTVSRFDERFDRLWEAASPGFDFVPDRRSAYLNWRYDPRGGASLVLVALDDQDLRGYAVLRWSGDTAQLVDLLVDPASPAVVATLAADAVDRARQRGARQLTCALPRVHPYRQPLLDHGFLDAGGDARLEYQPHGDRHEQLAFLGEDANARIHVTLGDFDYI